MIENRKIASLTPVRGSATGMRTAAQGYSVADNVRHRYADTRLDDATGLDHTLWRKLETRSGRWTTPDPFGGSLQVRDPQSFNRYAYVQNDPLNFGDPNGLLAAPFMFCLNGDGCGLRWLYIAGFGEGPPDVGWGSGGDGVIVSIKKGTQVLWNSTIESGNTTGVSYDVTTTVVAGDQINFVINQRSNTYFDSTTFDPTITFTPGQSATSYKASTDFSAVQGQSNWYYLDSNGTQLTYLNQWGGVWNLPNTSVYLGGSWGHPGDTSDAVRQWRAPGAGSIHITGTAFDNDAACGDGVIVSIKKGTQVLWSSTIDNGNQDLPAIIPHLTTGRDKGQSC